MDSTTATKTGQVFDWLVLRRLLTYVQPYRGVFIGLIFLTVASAALGTVRPALIQRMVDVDINNNDWAALNRSTVLLMVLLLVHTLVSYLQTYYGWANTLFATSAPTSFGTCSASSLASSTARPSVCS
jgi:ATP-binding cassette subfamily B multidrug efflux pump